MAIVRYQSPFGPLDDIRREMNRLFDSSCYGTSSEDEASFSKWRPSVDIKEEAKQYLVHADIPGVKAKDIKISLDNNTLTIQGERNLETTTEDKNYQRIERFSGNFFRQFALPQNVDGSKIQAKSKDGVLEICIPKLELATTKYINVESEH